MNLWIGMFIFPYVDSISTFFMQDIVHSYIAGLKSILLWSIHGCREHLCVPCVPSLCLHIM